MSNFKTMSSKPGWIQIEEYRKNLDTYERLRGDYMSLSEVYHQCGDDVLKTELDAKHAQLEDLYTHLSSARETFAEYRDQARA